MNSDEVNEAIYEECKKYDFVRFVWNNISGQMITKAVPNCHLKNTIKEGVSSWAGTLLIGPSGFIPHELPPGMTTVNSTQLPLAGMVHPLPWASNDMYKVGAVLCEPYKLDKKTPIDASTRYIARRQIERLAKIGMSLYSGFELEFIMFNDKWEPVIKDHNAFLICDVHAQFEKFMYTADKHLREIGVDALTYQAEYSASQLEMALAPKLGINSPDALVKCKQALKEIARQEGMNVVYMTKPVYNVGNGLHYNFSLIGSTTNENMFYDANKADNLSDIARHFLAGLIHHAPALTALLCPTINCYRRIATPWAPERCNWGLDDRTSTFRVKVLSPKDTYIENRLAGGSSNPYVTVAATLAAGLDGIEKKMKCPDPLDKSAEKLPLTFTEAIDILKNDKVICEAMGADFISWFLTEKEKCELPLFPDWNRADESEAALEKEKKIYMKTL